MLLITRLVLGLAVGAASATVPAYLGEISPAKIRGRILTLDQLMITIGIMFSYLTNLIFFRDRELARNARGRRGSRSFDHRGRPGGHSRVAPVAGH